MEVIGDSIGNNRMSGIVTSLASSNNIGLITEDVDELAFAFVAPLGSQNNGDPRFCHSSIPLSKENQTKTMIRIANCRFSIRVQKSHLTGGLCSVDEDLNC